MKPKEADSDRHEPVCTRGDCLSEEMITRLVQGTATAHDIQISDQRIDDCDRCRRVLAESMRNRRQATPELGTASDGGVLPQERPFPTGTMLLDRYRVLEFLGDGTVGQVYRVQDQLLGLEVALRWLDSPSAIQRKALRSEVVLGRELSHTNLCRLYDLIEAEDALVITMEYVAGETLRERSARMPMQAWEAWCTTDDVTSALSVLHARGKVHGNLTPMHIRMDDDGHAKVMGFGIFGEVPGIPGKVIRASPYQPPELAEGARATAASDVYSMVAIYCDMVGAGIPAAGDAPKLALLGPEFDRIAEKALSKRAADRYQSVAELRADLDRAWARQHRWRGPGVVLSATLVVIGLASAVTWWLW